jgi:hypothetical protein
MNLETIIQIREVYEFLRSDLTDTFQANFGTKANDAVVFARFLEDLPLYGTDVKVTCDTLLVGGVNHWQVTFTLRKGNITSEAFGEMCSLFDHILAESDRALAIVWAWGDASVVSPKVNRKPEMNSD